MSGPFDKARYAALLEGLEISEIRKTELNDETRYEAEFFRKRYLQENQSLSRWPLTTIGAFAAVTDGPHGYHVVDESSPIVMLTAKNARGWFSDREGADPIAKWVDEKNKRSSLAAGDVILSDRGTVGMCALVTEEALPANIDQDVARISWEDKKKLRPDYVVAYLNSSFGQDHMQRFATGMIQQGITLQKVRQIPIPLLSEAFQSAISGTVQSAYRAKCDSITHLTIAEQTLLAALDLADWHPPEPLTFTCSSKNVFEAGRLDSQYFAPRVAQMLARLRKDGLTVRDVAPPRADKFTPASEGTFRYIEISDLQSNGTAACETIDMRDAPSRATWMVKSGDVLTSTVRPNRRLSALVTPEQDGCVASSGFVVLQPKRVAAEVLLTYLRLPVFCELMDLHTSASLYPAISDRDLLALPFPKISHHVSDGIIAAVRSAHDARRQAQALLTRAQRAVEIAIEKNEASALRFVKEKGV